jgi:aminoglycoside/choline kinase family phosphotransferase
VLESGIKPAVVEFFVQWFGQQPDRVESLPPAGSARHYFRFLKGDRSWIGCWNTDVEENEAFIALARHLRGKDLPVPELLAVADSGQIYLQEDIGDQSLYSLLPARGEAFSDTLMERYRTVLSALARLQVVGDEGLPYHKTYPVERFDKDAMRWDLNYFKYFFLKLQEVPLREYELEATFRQFVDYLADSPAWYFMHRDCQSRNVFFRGEQPFFIDFQGGRKGPIAYDLASLLWQAKARIPQEKREDLVEHYLDALPAGVVTDRLAFRKSYYGFVLLRGLQVLGAYGFRGLIQKKKHFLDSIPLALENVRWLLEQGLIPVDFSALQSALQPLFEHYLNGSDPQPSGLTIRLTSFSFHRGIPDDPSGNGGGYVFDCRPILNPGRFEPYKKLTGLDQPVKQFLEEESGIQAFLDPVLTLIDRAVATYLERGFSNLQVSFGCTGGQHRSVYSAEHVARHLEKIAGVRVILEHRERSYWP